MPYRLFYQQEQLVSFHALSKFTAFSILKKPSLFIQKEEAINPELGGIVNKP